MIQRREGKKAAQYFFRNILKGWKETSHIRSNWKKNTPAELQTALEQTINSCKGFLRILSHIPGEGGSIAANLEDVWPSKMLSNTMRIRGTAAQKCTLQLMNDSGDSIFEHITNDKEWIQLRLQAERSKVTDQNHVEDYDTAAILLLELNARLENDPSRKETLDRIFQHIQTLHEGGLREEACENLEEGLLKALSTNVEDLKRMTPSMETIAMLQQISDRVKSLKFGDGMAAECAALQSLWQSQSSSTALLAALQQTKDCTAIQDTRVLHQALAAAQGQQIEKEVASLMVHSRVKIVSKIGLNILASGNGITDQCIRDEIGALIFLHKCPEFIAMVGGRGRDISTQRQIEAMHKDLLTLRLCKEYIIKHDRGAELEFNVSKAAKAIESWREFVKTFNDPDGHPFCF